MSEWNLSIPEEIYNAAGSDVALPAFYERACLAVIECESMPELNEWKGTAEAIIAYAKTVDDKRLENYGKRIKARAYRRMGELLKQYNGKGNNQHTVLEDSTQKEVAEQNGITPKKQRTAVNLANVPQQQFNEQIERETPATITALAEQGKNKRTGILYDAKPKGFTEAMYMRGSMSRMVEKMNQHDPLFIMGGMDSKDIEEMKYYINHIEAWCDTFIINLE